MALTSKQLALAEVVGFSILAVAAKFAADPISTRFSAPATLLLTLLVLAIYRRWRGQEWATVGLRALPGVKAKLLVIPQTLLALVAILGTGIVMAKLGEALGFAFMQPDPDAMQARWGDLKGNLPLYLVWLGLSWLSAAFAEETFFRGFVISRLIDAFSGLPFGRALAVVLAALFFGGCHVYYQGLRGLVVAGSIGLALGSLFLLYRRNLWPLMIAHGLVDTLMFTATFMDWDV